MWNNLVKLLATFFFVGYMPLAPGSMASLAGLLLYFIFFEQTKIYLLVLCVVLAAGFAVSGRMEKIAKKKDPSCVVIDEVAGMMITLLFLPKIPAVMFTAYFLFRAFDMFKIYPANRFEKLPGSMGIMMDDIIAGVYANIVMHLGLALTRYFA